MNDLLQYYESLDIGNQCVEIVEEITAMTNSVSITVQVKSKLKIKLNDNDVLF